MTVKQGGGHLMTVIQGGGGRLMTVVQGGGGYIMEDSRFGEWQLANQINGQTA